MTRPLAERLETQRQRTELADLQLKEKFAKKVTRKLNMKYDATNANLDRQRRQPPRETKTEDKVTSSTENAKAISVGRDLRRNNASWKTLETQLCTVTVGTGPKLQFHAEDEDPFWKEAASWFNGKWAKECDGIDDSPLGDLLWNIMAAVPREGDILPVFDDFDRRDGTLRFFEANQLTNVDDADWEKMAKTRGFLWKEPDPKDARKRIPMVQERGIVRDRRGRVQGYVVSSGFDKKNIPFKDATIIPAWHPRNPEVGSGKLVKFPWRFGQYRGVGDALTVANQQRDIYEMLSAELQSAKKAAQYFATISADSEGEDGIIRALKRGNLTSEEIDKIMNGNGEGDNGVTGMQYDDLEGVFGGRLEYLQPGDNLNLVNSERPNENIAEFASRVQSASGASMGIARSRALLQANGSYTAFRGEELMTWETARIWQKRLERRVMDFLAYKAISFGIDRNQIDSTPPDNWWRFAAWQWPEMREVDEVRAANAQRLYLKNGTKSLNDYLGPDAESKLRLASKILDVAKELGLPLSMFESISGAELQDDNEDDDND